MPRTAWRRPGVGGCRRRSDDPARDTRRAGLSRPGMVWLVGPHGRPSVVKDQRFERSAPRLLVAKRCPSRRCLAATGGCPSEMLSAAKGALTRVRSGSGAGCARAEFAIRSSKVGWARLLRSRSIHPRSCHPSPRPLSALTKRETARRWFLRACRGQHVVVGDRGRVFH